MSGSLSASIRFLPIDLVGMFACAGILVLGYTFGVDPFVNRNVHSLLQRSEIGFYAAEIAQAETTINGLQRESAVVRQTARDHPPLRLKPQLQSNQRLAELARLAAAHQLDLDEVRMGEATSGNQVEAVPIRLVGAGGFQAICAFLHELNAVFRDIEIAALKLSDNPFDPAAKTALELETTWYTAPAVPLGDAAQTSVPQ